MGKTSALPFTMAAIMLVVAMLLLAGCTGKAQSATEQSKTILPKEMPAKEVPAEKETKENKSKANPQSGLESGTRFAGCEIFPSDDPWNTPISDSEKYPVDPNSANYINTLGGHKTSLHPDMGGAAYGEVYGIPSNIVDGTEKMEKITYDAYGDESDPVSVPMPENPNIEGGSDAHLIVIDKSQCILYELYATKKAADGWHADSGVLYDLSKPSMQRPYCWTSADAAGLPIYPGLVKLEEVNSGKITHAFRFTAKLSQRGFIAPATHYASKSTNSNYLPMGLRLRLKASYDVNNLKSKTAQTIATALKEYGIMMADNGGNLFITGEANPNWNDDELNELKSIKADDFEAISSGAIKGSDFCKSHSGEIPESG